MATNDVLDNFRAIQIESPADIIIRQIRDLISSGQLNAGDRLPSERKLAERFDISRSHVRIALQKLEFYGILRTLPQSGTIVAGIGIEALEGLIIDVLKIDNAEFSSLVETRVCLEIEAARFAATRRTAEDIKAMEEALIAHENAVLKGQPAIEQDLMFHLTIAEAAKNTVLKSLMLIITPDIIKNFNEFNVCKNDRVQQSLEEHKNILKQIKSQHPDAAARAMEEHLQEVLTFSKSLF